MSEKVEGDGGAHRVVASRVQSNGWRSFSIDKPMCLTLACAAKHSTTHKQHESLTAHGPPSGHAPTSSALVLLQARFGPPVSSGRWPHRKSYIRHSIASAAGLRHRCRGRAGLGCVRTRHGGHRRLEGGAHHHGGQVKLVRGQASDRAPPKRCAAFQRRFSRDHFVV